jgi:hypothetical protein
MLAPLGFYLLIVSVACTTILLICWAYDTDKAEIEPGLSHPADLEFPVHPHARRSHARFPAPRLPERGRRSRPLRPRLNSSNGRPMAGAGTATGPQFVCLGKEDGNWYAVSVHWAQIGIRLSPPWD